jgi:tripartite-type tricarboxylate transporter receptor subunit TctC
VLAPHLKSGRIKAFAITAKKRWVEFPDLPTTEEAGLKGFTYIPFYGYWYPAGVPKEYVVRMRNEIAKVLEQPDAKKAFLDQGFDVVGSTPEEFARIVIAEIELNRKLAQTIDFSEK